MKTKIGILALLVFSAPGVYAADVRLNQLKDFDRSVHSISVRLHTEVGGGCLPNAENLEDSFKTELAIRRFRIAPYKESDIEFAVVAKGFTTSGPQHCGVMLTSKVRQIPKIRILRLPPESPGTEYRLWAIEHVLTGGCHRLQRCPAKDKEVVDGLPFNGFFC
jgi:hypothetical protein